MATPLSRWRPRRHLGRANRRIVPDREAASTLTKVPSAAPSMRVDSVKKGLCRIRKVLQKQGYKRRVPGPSPHKAGPHQRSNLYYGMEESVKKGV